MVSPRIPAIGVLASAVMFSAAPAVAQSGTFADPAGDVAGVPYLDLRAVTVKNTATYVRVAYTTRSLGNLNGTEAVLFDTNAKRSGPELQVGFGRYSEGWTTPMRRWKADRSKAAKRKWNPNPFGKPGTCDATVRIASRWQRGFTPVTVTVRKKKGCLAGKRVRVQVSTSTEAFNDLRTSDAFGRVFRDRLPGGTREFTGWVRQRSKKAAPRRFVDGADSVPWWSDVLSVSVSHATDRLGVSIRHRARPVNRHGTFDTLVDTNADGVPNWLLRVTSAGVALYPATGFGQYGPKVGACFTEGSLAGVGLTTTSVAVATSCLGDPASVRVAVLSDDATTTRFRPTDWLGGTRRWTDSVARG